VTLLSATPPADTLRATYKWGRGAQTPDPVAPERKLQRSGQDSRRDRSSSVPDRMEDGMRPTITLSIADDSRELFGECARFYLDRYDAGDFPETDQGREQYREVAALVAQLDGRESVQIAPRIAWSVLDDCLARAIHGVKDATLGADQIDVAEVDKATTRVLCFAREIAQLETLSVPTTEAVS
jgi:hypothetical protein